MSRISHFRVVWPGFFLAFLALLVGDGNHLLAAGFRISPPSITNDYNGSLSVLITNVPAGATVRLEEFLDINTNGLIDSTDLLVSSVLITDGKTTSFGGVVDASIPGDQDAVAGHITASISFLNAAEVTHAAGTHLVRLSSPTAAFSSVVVPFVVAQPVYPQGVSGLVTNSAGGVSQAVVGVLSAATGEVVDAAVTDGTGHYSLKLAPGDYGFFCFKPGFISGFGAQEVIVAANQFTNQNLLMTTATRTISGIVSDSATGAGLPGVEILAQSTTNNAASLTCSDTNGNFTLSVSPDQYKMSFSDKSLQQMGYLRPGTKPKVNVTSGNATGLKFALNKATSLIYGSLKDSANAPLAGVSIGASDDSGLYNSSDLTDTNGNYTLAIVGGTNWSIGPDTSSPLLQGYSVNGTNLFVAANQGARVDFVATRSTAVIAGRVVDNTGTGQGGLNIFASLSSGQGISATTAADGSFALAVSGGTWELTLDTTSLGSQNWLIPSLSIPVTDGVDVSNVVFEVLNATSSVTGFVTDSTGTGLSGIHVIAGGSIGGTNYGHTVVTAANGSYSIGVINGPFQVWVNDCAGIPQSQSTYSCPTNNFQNVNISGAGTVVNFVLLPPLQLSFFFRHFTYGGDFGNGSTPVTHFPISIKGYLADLLAQNGSSFAPVSSVLFTGPPGSGLTNTPANRFATGGNFENYFSPNVFAPQTAPGGTWTVSYNGTATNFTVADPQAASRLFAPVPTVTVTGGNLTAVSWVLKDVNGNLLPGSPAYVTRFQINIFDQDLNLLHSSTNIAVSATQYTLPVPISWSTVRRVTTLYSDTLGNKYLLNCDRATPTLGSASRANGQFQLLANGLALDTYTVEFSTTLTNWFILYVTNPPAGSFNVIDSNTLDSQRFYRVSVTE